MSPIMRSLVAILFVASSSVSHGRQICERLMQNEMDFSELSSDSERMIEVLSDGLKGQDHVLQEVFDHVLAARSGLNNPNQPIVSVLALGPTGVGKTLTAEMLALALHGDAKKMIKLNAAEFKQPHAVSRLHGAPPSYLGYKDPPIFTNEKLKKFTSDSNPYTIILLDEIEKAHQDFFDVLLSIFDKGELQLASDNSIVDFRKTIIIMTSNLGVAELEKKISERASTIGFQQTQTVKKADKEQVYTAAMKGFFKPEFLNRVDVKVVYNSFDLALAQATLKLEIDKANKHFEKNLGDLGFTFELTDNAFDRVLEIANWEVYGGRNIAKTLDKIIKIPFARGIDSRAVLGEEHFLVDFDRVENRFRFYKDPDKKHSVPPPGPSGIASASQQPIVSASKMALAEQARKRTLDGAKPPLAPPTIPNGQPEPKTPGTKKTKK